MKQDSVPTEITPQMALRSVLATDFTAFTEYAFSLLRPGTPFRRNWHIEAMTHKLAEVASGRIKRLIINVPPRNLKSICASVALPAFYLGHNPAERVVCVSYSDSLAKTHSNDFRRVVNDELYQTIFPRMRVSKDTDSEIHTADRGRRYATSIEGTLTGRGGNLIIIDDPIKPGDVMSEAARQKSIEWYRGTLVTRADDKKAAAIVVVMQRIHQEDLCGFLIEQGGFEVLSLPAVAQSEQTYDLGHGRQHTRRRAEILHPDHEPVEVLLDLKKNMGPIAFSAQYQQSPVPPGGVIVKRKWLKYFDQQPGHESGDDIFLSWDIALSEKETGDYSVGVVLLRRGEKFFVLDVVRGRFPFEKLKKTIIEQKAMFPRATLIIEESPISLGLIQVLNNMHFNVIAPKPDRDKTARLISQTDLFAGGSIFLPSRADWLDEFVHELLSFPGRHDDQVDALVQGLAYSRDLDKFYFRPGRTTGMF